MKCRYANKNNDQCCVCVCNKCKKVNKCNYWADCVCDECNKGIYKALLTCNKGEKVKEKFDFSLLSKQETKILKDHKEIREELLAYGGALLVCRDCGRWADDLTGIWICGTTGICDKCLEVRFRRKHADCKCSKCSNLVFIGGGLHCKGYGRFGKWAKKCGENTIVGRFEKINNHDNVCLDENGLNANIQFYIKDDETMIKAGFRNNPKNWYLFKILDKSANFAISINITIPKNSKKRGRIEVLDEAYLQPYDYQSMNNKYAKKIKNKVDEELEKLTKIGIITGFERGIYV